MATREKVKGTGNKGFYMVHNMGHITYQYVKSVNGVKLTGTCESLALAKELFEAEKAQVMAGTFCNKKGTLKQVYNNFLAVKRTTVGKSRLDDIEWSYKLHIAPYLDCDRQIKSFGKEDIEFYLIKLHEDPISESTKINVWQVFKMLFQYATVNDYIARDLTYGKKYIIPKEKRVQEETPYSTEEQKKLLDYTRINPGKEADYYLCFLLTIKAGLRLGEMVGLRWKDLNIEEKAITIAGQHNVKEDCRSATKAGNIRTVLINKDLLSYLLELKARLSPQPDDYLFPSWRGTRKLSGKPLAPCALGTKMADIGETLGIENVHPHRGRHTFATELKLHGADKDDVSRMLGHTLQSVTDGYIYSKIGYQPCTIRAIDLIGAPVNSNIIPFPDSSKSGKITKAL